jgi:tetratricopeptide (TPR) repeat protein
MDGQWPEAFAWAALCAYELDDIRSAADYLEKAQRLNADLSRSNKKLPQLEALAAIIRRKQPGQAIKAEAALANAIRLADKNSDWETYFLLGRYYFEVPDDGVRAQMHFQRALAIESNCDCARLWLARLQSTSTLPTVRDLYAGTTCLEQLWKKSGEQSWRLACFLAEAYSASERETEAEEMRRTAAELAPADHKVRLLRR